MQIDIQKTNRTIRTSRTVRTSLYFLILFAGVFSLVQNSNAAVIMSDDFEGHSSSWNCSQDIGSPWIDNTSYNHCQSTSGFGYEFKMGAGHNSNNAIYSWKKNIAALSGYRGDLTYYFPSSNPTEIYMRWYMKIPPASLYDKSGCYSGFKFWRYQVSRSGSAGYELYLNADTAAATDGKFSNSYLSIYKQNVGDSDNWLHLIPIASINDGSWHYFEMHFKMNSTAAANDGIFEFWFDSTSPLYSSAAFHYGNENDLWFDELMEFGIGNTSMESTFSQTDWSAIAFDDVVIADSYIGPITSSDVTAPDVPSGLSVS